MCIQPLTASRFYGGLRYGGVWVDISLCPVQPLDGWLPAALAPTGFFSLWRNQYGQTPDDRIRDTTCHTDLVTHGAFSVTIPNYFLAVGVNARGANASGANASGANASGVDGSGADGTPLVRAWLLLFYGRLASTVLGQEIPYFLAACTLTQLVEGNASLATYIDRMPHVSPWALEGVAPPGERYL